MVEEVAGWLDTVKAEADEEKWLGLLQTLRAVTEGKVNHSGSYQFSRVDELVIPLPLGSP